MLTSASVGKEQLDVSPPAADASPEAATSSPATDATAEQPAAMLPGTAASDEAGNGAEIAEPTGGPQHGSSSRQRRCCPRRPFLDATYAKRRAANQTPCPASCCMVK